ncbi:hypothetical protein GOBAR_AA01708 [Gossypium barbadense]|uniref:Uncharacterized protein n=1 Tax=Gossypium barbadense TaxID=3634 RepID=A0A2P5YTL3_GOSBA|nr:hypothetical protein GOBAR_AA01708 [Gossypium barbadense]
MVVVEVTANERTTGKEGEGKDGKGKVRERWMGERKGKTICRRVKKKGKGGTARETTMRFFWERSLGKRWLEERGVNDMHGGRFCNMGEERQKEGTMVLNGGRWRRGCKGKGWQIGSG